MKISKLPKKYKELAIKRAKEERGYLNSNLLTLAFSWIQTPEGWVFWSTVECAKKIEELPPIPKKIKEPKLVW